METLETISKIAAIVFPTVAGVFAVLAWFLRRIERGQERMLKKINKIDKHKVSYKVCDKRRAECPCKPERERG